MRRTEFADFAHWLLLPYLLESELRDRGIPGQATPGTALWDLFPVRDVLSATSGRANRAPTESAVPVLRGRSIEETRMPQFFSF